MMRTRRGTQLCRHRSGLTSYLNCSTSSEGGVNEDLFELLNCLKSHGVEFLVTGLGRY